jgi:uncharacterized membrane protein YphA (DoxX/SURF4 family)
MKGFFCILGRVFISCIFIASGMQKLLDWNETESAVSKMLSEWGQLSGNIDIMQAFFIYISPYADILVLGAIFFEVIGGIMVLFGCKARLGAGILFVFLLIATFLFHPFWAYEDSMQKLQLIMFLKNFAIMGGLLYIMAFGSGTGEYTIACKPKR